MICRFGAWVVDDTGIRSDGGPYHFGVPISRMNMEVSKAEWGLIYYWPEHLAKHKMGDVRTFYDAFECALNRLNTFDSLKFLRTVTFVNFTYLGQ